MPVGNKKSDALVSYEAQFAEAAKASADQVASLGGSQFFSIKGGKIKLGDSTPVSDICVVVLDYVFENAFYTEAYDANNPAGPDCYAFGRKLDEMVPHEACEGKVSDACKGCPNNEWGSASRGKGKACKNKIRLALLPAGMFEDGRFEAISDVADIEGASVAYLSIPPTSANGFGAYVKSLNDIKHLPPFAVFTKVHVEPDDKVQVRVSFELLGPCPASFAKTLIARNATQKEEEIQPYAKREEKPVKTSNKKRRF